MYIASRLLISRLYTVSWSLASLLNGMLACARANPDLQKFFSLGHKIRYTRRFKIIGLFLFKLIVSFEGSARYIHRKPIILNKSTSEKKTAYFEQEKNNQLG